MALNAYVSATQLLLSNPAAPATLYSTANITQFVNTARVQLAGESECCRATGNLAVITGSISYNFSAITNLPAGAAGAYNVRQVTRVSGSGQVYMGPRPYPWAVNYWLNNAAPVAAAPTEWSQYGIGATGSLIVNPAPNQNYTLNLDVAAVPSALTTDTTPEIIPYAYTDCVPFFAAFYAYMSAQRQSDADKMYTRYQEFLGRARKIAVPNVLPMQYDQMEVPPARPQAGGA
jgi:hypothetical protein